MAGLALLVGSSLGFVVRVPVVHEEEVRAELRALTTLWEAEGFTVTERSDGHRLTTEPDAQACTVVLRGAWGEPPWRSRVSGSPLQRIVVVPPPYRSRYGVGVTESASCGTDRLPLDNLGLPSPGYFHSRDLAVTRGAANVVLRAPMDRRHNPLTMGQDNRSSRYAYTRAVATREAERFGEPLRGAWVSSSRFVSLVPDNAVTRVWLARAGGIRPSTSRLPAAEGIAVPGVATAEAGPADAPNTTDAANTTDGEPEAAPAIAAVPRQGAHVLRHHSLERGLLVADPAALPGDCVRFIIMSTTRHRTPIWIRNLTSGAERTVEPRDDSDTLSSVACDEDGPVLLGALPARGQEFAIVLVPVARPSDLARPTLDAAIEGCLSSDEGISRACIQIARELTHGSEHRNPAPVLAERIAAAGCDEARPTTCLPLLQARLALADADGVRASLPTLDRACEAGSYEALVLRAEMARSGLGIEKSRANAVADYARACELIPGEACTVRRQLAVAIPAGL